MTIDINAEHRAGLLPGLFYRNRLLILVVLVHWLAAVAIGMTMSIPFESSTAATLGMVFGVLLPWFVLILLIWRFADMAIRVRPDRPIQWLIADLRATLLDPERMLGGLLRLLLMVVMVGTFSYLKSIIPAINDFGWDSLFAQMDRALHGGVDPYVLLMKLTGTPLITTAINAAYHFWLFMVYFVIFLACFARHDRRSADTLLVAMALTFIIGGNLLATVFSSAGPVYYEALGLGPDFAPLMDTLRRFAEISPVWALNVQETLWQGHIADGPISGISAMPSMHMASSTLLAFYGFRHSRWAGWVLTGFALLILIGSVHLGWHYAIDSYAGALVAALCWFGASRLTAMVRLT